MYTCLLSNSPATFTIRIELRDSLNECVTRDEGLSHVLLNTSMGGHVHTLEWVVPFFGYEVYMNDVIVRVRPFVLGYGYVV